MFTRADKFALSNCLAWILFLVHTRFLSAFFAECCLRYFIKRAGKTPVFELSINVSNDKRRELRFCSKSMFSNKIYVKHDKLCVCKSWQSKKKYAANNEKKINIFPSRFHGVTLFWISLTRSDKQIENRTLLTLFFILIIYYLFFSAGDIYLLLTEFEGRTVSYGPSFFLLDLWPKREARRP